MAASPSSSNATTHLRRRPPSAWLSPGCPIPEPGTLQGAVAFRAADVHAEVGRLVAAAATGTGQHRIGDNFRWVVLADPAGMAALRAAAAVIDRSGRCCALLRGYGVRSHVTRYFGVSSIAVGCRSGFSFAVALPVMCVWPTSVSGSSAWQSAHQSRAEVWRERSTHGRHR